MELEKERNEAVLIQFRLIQREQQHIQKKAIKSAPTQHTEYCTQILNNNKFRPLNFRD